MAGPLAGIRVLDLGRFIACPFCGMLLADLGAEAIQTDNGAEFRDQFHWHILDKGINHVYIKPRMPRLNGKVERRHRIMMRSSTEYWRE